MAKITTMIKIYLALLYIKNQNQNIMAKITTMINIYLALLYIKLFFSLFVLHVGTL